jgi:hypothetical protein
MAHLDLSASKVVADPLRHDFLDAEPYRLKGGVRREFIFAAGFGRWTEGLEIRAR